MCDVITSVFVEVRSFPCPEDEKIVQFGLRQHNDQHVSGEGDSRFAVLMLVRIRNLRYARSVSRRTPSLFHAQIPGRGKTRMSIARISFIEVQRNYRRYGPAFPRHLQRRYGDLFVAKAPLLPPIIFALHPEHVTAVLAEPDPPLEKPELLRRILRASFGNGLFTSQGAFWRRQRALMQPAFHQAQIRRYAEKMVAHTQAMLAGWEDGTTLSIGEAMHELTLTIVLDALFSAGEGEQDTAPIHTAIRDLGQGLAAISQSLPLVYLPAWAPHPALRRKRRGERALARIVQQMIAERRPLGPERSPDDLLTTLLFAHDEETGETMSDRQLQDELITLYIAGHDTTAILLSWAWVLLAQHPAAAGRLRAELDELLNGRAPTVDDLPKLTETQAVVKETLRLYPPAWFLFRQAPAGFQLGGETLPGGILFLMPYTTQRDGRWFAEPDAFQPERWAGGLERRLPRGAYFPFGLGPRHCIGQGFARMEAQLLLVTIAQRFHLEERNEAKMGHTATLGFAEPVAMRLEKRSG